MCMKFSSSQDVNSVILNLQKLVPNLVSSWYSGERGRNVALLQSRSMKTPFVTVPDV